MNLIELFGITFEEYIPKILKTISQLSLYIVLHTII